MDIQMHSLYTYIHTDEHIDRQAFRKANRETA